MNIQAKVRWVIVDVIGGKPGASTLERFWQGSGWSGHIMRAERFRTLKGAKRNAQSIRNSWYLEGTLVLRKINIVETCTVIETYKDINEEFSAPCYEAMV